MWPKVWIVDNLSGVKWEFFKVDSFKTYCGVCLDKHIIYFAIVRRDGRVI